MSNRFATPAAERSGPIDYSRKLVTAVDYIDNTKSFAQVTKLGTLPFQPSPTDAKFPVHQSSSETLNESNALRNSTSEQRNNSDSSGNTVNSHFNDNFDAIKTEINQESDSIDGSYIHLANSFINNPSSGTPIDNNCKKSLDYNDELFVSHGDTRPISSLTGGLSSVEPIETFSEIQYEDASSFSEARVQTPSYLLGHDLGLDESDGSEATNFDKILLSKLDTLSKYKEDMIKTKSSKTLHEYAKYTLEIASEINIDELTHNKEEFGLLKKQLFKETVYYLKKLAVKGYPDSQYLLADLYSSGKLGKYNYKESYILFQTAAKHGHVDSAFRTALCYEEGVGTVRDARKAVEFLKFAASRHHTEAMLKLGLYSYYGGMGLGNDLNTKQNGIKWLTRAVARTDEKTCSAPYELGKIYDKGFLDIIIPDQKYAMNLYIQSSALGYVKSTTKIGQIYEKGNSFVAANSLLSIHYYTKAATDPKYPDPQAQLGLCGWYLLGSNEMERDENEAFLWALKSAEAGHPKAQYAVGNFYERGVGCSVDFNQAFQWYEKAAKNQNIKAKEKIRKMTNRDADDFFSSVSSRPSKKSLRASNSSTSLFKSVFSNKDDDPSDFLIQLKKDQSKKDQPDVSKIDKQEDNIDKTRPQESCLNMEKPSVSTKEKAVDSKEVKEISKKRKNDRANIKVKNQIKKEKNLGCVIV